MTETDPNGKLAHESGAKLDNGKIRAWLCLSGFAKSLAEVASVTTIGAEKYSPNGWKSVPNGADRYMEAFARHLLQLADGQVIDQDTGCLHKAQMIWNLLASLEIEIEQADIELD